MKKNSKYEKRYSIIFSLLLILTMFSLFILGCSQNNRPQILNIYTGTQGVTAQFTPNNPPEQVYEDSQVILMAEIWNRGAFTPLQSKGNSPIFISVNVDEVYFKILGGTGLVQNSNGANGAIAMYLSGKSQSWPIGEKTIIPIAVLNVSKILGTRESPTTKIEVSACYQYTTYFAHNICVDSDMYNLDKNPVCRNQRTYTFTGQGAPLIVSKLEVDMIPIGVDGGLVPISVPVVDEEGKIQNIADSQGAGKSIIVEPNFRIYFTNTDKGVVLSTEDNKNPCEFGPSQKGKALRIKAYLSDKELTCTGTELNMYSNEGSVRCWLPKDQVPPEFTLNRNFELPLRIEAEYFYRTTTAKDVKIMRIS